MEAEELLTSLRAEGHTDSSGEFTQDPERARQLIADKLNIDPHAYALCMVSAGVAQGAQELKVQSDRKRFSVSYDGPSLTSEELQALKEGQNCRAPHLHQLHLGILAAWAIRAQKVTLECPHGTLIMTPSRSELHPGAHQGTRVAVDFAKGGWLSRMFGSDVVVRTIQKRCRYARPRIVLNGERLQHTMNAEQSPAVRILTAPGEAAPSVLTERGGNVAQEESSYSGALAWRSGATSIKLVTLGVSHEVPAPWNLPVGGYVHCDRLKKDLSLNQLIKDDQYWEVMAWLEEQCRALAVQLRSAWEHLNEPSRVQAWTALEGLARADQNAGRYSEAEELMLWLLSGPVSRYAGQDADLETLRLRLAAVSANQYGAGKALEMFLAVGHKHRRLNRPAEAAHAYNQALRLEPQLDESYDDLLVEALAQLLECRGGGSMHERLALQLRQRKGVDCCQRCFSRKMFDAPFQPAGDVAGKPVKVRVCATCGLLEWTLPEAGQLWSEFRNP